MRFRRRRRIHVLVRSKRTLLLIWIVIVCIFGSLFFLIADMKLRPIIREMALTRAQYLATRAINDAVTQEISRHDAEYTNLVIFEKDADNRISALKTDVIKVNQLKTSVTDAVLTCLGEIDTSELSVPIGNAIGGGLLSGRGPRIPVKLLPIGTVTTDFASAFSSAGINQTRHQIIMHVTASIRVILPGGSVTTDVTLPVNVAETILVGTVPGNYTYIDDTESSILGKINDYARQ